MQARHCEFSTGLRPTRLDETGDPHRNLMVRSRALARRLEPWAARPSFETHAQESALLRMRAYFGAKLERNQYFKPLFLFRSDSDEAIHERRRDVSRDCRRLLLQRAQSVKDLRDRHGSQLPVLDGGVIPRDPIESFRNGSAGWCDMVIGVTREEYAAFSVSNPGLDELSDEQLLRLIRIQLGESADDALRRIRTQRVPATPRAILGDMHSEQTFIGPSLAIAATQAKIGRHAFVYFFDWQSPNPALGACHCIDLPFLFGNLGVWKAAPMLSGADWREVRELSRLFRGAFAAFTQHGDPNGNRLPKWPSHEFGRAVLHFDRRITASGWLD
jgi:carboxylesterase type B